MDRMEIAINLEAQGVDLEKFADRCMVKLAAGEPEWVVGLERVFPTLSLA